MSDFGDRLRREGKRLTPQREMILRAVERLGHATPDEVLAEVRTESAAVNISTVYRTLEVLEELELIRHTHLSDRAPTYHSVTGHEHFHLVCRGCQDVISVASEEFADFGSKLRSEYGFHADIGHLAIFGLCQRCRDCE